MVNLSPIASINLLSFLTLLALAFYSSNLLLSCIICFQFCFECIDFSLYTESDFIGVKVKLTSTCFSL